MTGSPYPVNGARITANGLYRESLWRYWDDRPKVVWIMLNPSTADAETDDPTIRKCMKFARSWDYGGIVVVNLFAYRATDPKVLRDLEPHVAIGPGGNEHIADTAFRSYRDGGLVVAAWGQHGKLHGRAASVKFTLETWRIPLHALKLSKDGTPYHPLYLRDDTKPFPLK